MKKNKFRKKILIAEDEIIIALDIKKILNDFSYKNCSIVFSGEEAIKKASEEKPALILMDIMLQGSINGIEAAETISREQNIPIIFLTAAADAETLEKVRIKESFGYVGKPYDEQTLCSTIETVLNKYNNTADLMLRPELFGKNFKISDFKN